MKLRIQTGHHVDINARVVDPKVQMYSEVRKPFKIDKDKEYDGQYRVIPKAWERQTLHTKEKVLRENVVVTEVPYRETRNDTGTTVYIASGVE